MGKGRPVQFPHGRHEGHLFEFAILCLTTSRQEYPASNAHHIAMQTSQALSICGASQLFGDIEMEEIKWAERVAPATTVVVTRSSGMGEQWSVRLADESEEGLHECDDEKCCVNLERLDLDMLDPLWKPSHRRLCVKYRNGTWETHRLSSGSVCAGDLVLPGVKAHYSIESSHLPIDDRLVMRVNPLTDSTQDDAYEESVRQCAKRASENISVLSDPRVFQECFKKAMTEYVENKGRSWTSTELGEVDGFHFTDGVPYTGIDLFFRDQVAEVV